MKCLASQNQVELLILEKNLNLQKAIDGTKIQKLEKLLGEVNIAKVITYLLMRFSDSFNVGKNLTSSQAPMIAVDIMEKYPYETIEDVVLMLKQVRQGSIGDGKDFKLDGQNVLAKWFPEYLDKKYSEVERINKTAHQTSEPKTEKSAVEIFYEKRRLQKANEEKQRLAKLNIDEMVKTMDRQMLEDTIQDWQKKEEMKPYLDYLKSKRISIK